MKLPEPWGRMDQRGRLLSDNDSSGAKLFTEAQYRQGQRDALEVAARICESRKTPGTGSVAILNGAEDDIRKFMEGL